MQLLKARLEDSVPLTTGIGSINLGHVKLLGTSGTITPV